MASALAFNGAPALGFLRAPPVGLCEVVRKLAEVLGTSSVPALWLTQREVTLDTVQELTRYCSQKWWMSARSTLSRSQVLAPSGARSQQLVKCHSVVFASAWLSALPSASLGLCLAPAEFRVLVRWWLGLPQLSETSACPICGHTRNALGDHAMGCLSGGVTRRHNLVRDEIVKLSRFCGFTVQREVSLTSGLRPADVLLLEGGRGGRPLAVDVSIVDFGTLGGRLFFGMYCHCGEGKGVPCCEAGWDRL